MANRHAIVGLDTIVLRADFAQHRLHVVHALPCDVLTSGRVVEDFDGNPALVVRVQ